MSDTLIKKEPLNLRKVLKENTMLENMPSLLNALNDIISLNKTDKK